MDLESPFLVDFKAVLVLHVDNSILINKLKKGEFKRKFGDKPLLFLDNFLLQKTRKGTALK